MDLFWLCLAVVAGGCIALQAAANGSLRANIDSVWYAAFYSICGTILTAVLFIVFAQPTAPSMAAVRSTPWWNWIGGPLGATVVLAGASLISRLGATAFAAAFVGGQLVFSLLLDHYGWMDLPQESITAGRLAGAALVFAGMLMVRYL